MNTDIKPMDVCEIGIITSLDEDSENGVYNVIIMSNDGYACTIKKKYTYISDFLAGMYEGDSDAGKPGTEINLNKLSGNSLRLIEEYMNHHKGKDDDIPKMPLEDTDMKKIFKDEWDADFLERLVPTTVSETNSSEVIPNLGGLIELLTISNYLGMTVLLHKLSAKFASFLRNKGEEEISRFLASYSNNS